MSRGRGDQITRSDWCYCHSLIALSLSRVIGQHLDSANFLVYHSAMCHTASAALSERKGKFTEGDSVHPVQFQEHDLQGFFIHSFIHHLMSNRRLMGKFQSFVKYGPI